MYYKASLLYELDRLLPQNDPPDFDDPNYDPDYDHATLEKVAMAKLKIVEHAEEAFGEEVLNFIDLAYDAEDGDLSTATLLAAISAYATIKPKE